MTERELYEGFGEEHSAKEWAKLLDIRFGVLSYCLEKEKKTVEEMANFFGVVYPQPKKRKPREGAHMVEGRKLIEELFRRSGQEVKEGSVVLSLIRNTTHKVTFNGQHVGKYDYKTGCLGNLFEGRFIPLKAEYSRRLKIQQNKYGCWELTPETQTIITREQMAKIEQSWEPVNVEACEGIANRVESKRAIKKEETLYEYKGRKATCAEWARRWEVSDQALRYHLNRGQTLEEIAEKWGK